MLWKGYSCAVDAIVYMIDSFDINRIQESRNELWTLLATEEYAHCPILVIGNKIDLIGSLTEHQLLSIFQLRCTGKVCF